MYGCTNPEEVLSEIRACTSAFPDCFIRVAGFDNIKQVQCSSFLAHRPANDRTFAAVNNRQAGASMGGGGGGGKLLSFSLNNLISSTRFAEVSRPFRTVRDAWHIKSTLIAFRMGRGAVHFY